MSTPPAIAVFEFESIAIGTRAADAMIKKATLDLFRVGTVQPGKHLVLIGGSVAAVEESRIEGLRVGAEALTQEIFLPDVHPQVVSALGRGRQANEGDALGIIETSTIPATVLAADRAVKTADVTIIEIRLGDGLGGKGITHLAGLLHDVEAAIEAGVTAATRMDVTIWQTIIPIQHDELRECIGHATEFHV